MKNKINCTLLLVLTMTGLVSCGDNKPTVQVQTADQQTIIPAELIIEIPIAGNSWVKDDLIQSTNLISEAGLQQWQNIDDEIITFVYLTATGKLDIGFKGYVKSGTSTLEISVGEETKQVSISNMAFEDVYVGQFNIQQIGYHKIILKGISASAATFADISHILIGGEATEKQSYFVKDDFYWGRRGPSVHLNFTVPNPNENNEWFYTELEVPEGQDTLGSYFMTNGFSQGYMGIQVNSATERRVLFSVWSAYDTDDPNMVPDDYKVELLEKGDNVIAGEFGNEGVGAQSYYIFDWKPATTYRFLVRIRPADITGKSDYSAYFFAPEINEWKLIASFRRPKIETFVTNPYSFLENFIPAAGQFERKSLYKNQWLRNESGQWHELTEANFTYDSTASKKARLDYQGGVEEGVFFLRNTGFFTGATQYNTLFTREQGTMPIITMDTLP